MHGIPHIPPPEAGRGRARIPLRRKSAKAQARPIFPQSAVTFLVPRSVTCWPLINNAAQTPKVSWLCRHARENNSKKRCPGWNDPLACASFRQPVIPPAPLTGDAGRGCGDASRAPILFAEMQGISTWPPHHPPDLRGWGRGGHNPNQTAARKSPTPSRERRRAGFGRKQGTAGPTPHLPGPCPSPAKTTQVTSHVGHGRPSFRRRCGRPFESCVHR